VSAAERNEGPHVGLGRKGAYHDSRRSYCRPRKTSVVLLIDDVNRQLDRLEGDLKKLFPGQPPDSLAALGILAAYDARGTRRWKSTRA
jgi:hypothetical protein